MIVGFNFNRINVERKSRVTGRVKISHDLHIKEIEEVKIPLKERKALGFNFVYIINYEPNIGEILIDGDVLYSGKEDVVKDVLNKWRKDKKVAKEVSIEVGNFIMNRCNVKALELAQELSLPSHIPLPRVQVNKEQLKDYIG